jgi:hypothetical protein
MTRRQRSNEGGGGLSGFRISVRRASIAPSVWPSPFASTQARYSVRVIAADAQLPYDNALAETIKRPVQDRRNASAWAVAQSAGR